MSKERFYTEKLTQIDSGTIFRKKADVINSDLFLLQIEMNSLSMNYSNNLFLYIQMGTLLILEVENSFRIVDLASLKISIWNVENSKEP